MTIKTFSYNEFELIVEQSKEKLLNFIEENKIHINYILSASKEDHIFNSMLALELNIESIFINKEDEDFKVKEILEKTKNSKSNILLVQSILNKSDIDELKKILNQNELYLLAAFAPKDGENIIKNKTVIVNTTNIQELKLPWDRSQFTPLNQLEKLQGVVRVDLTKLNRNFLGFSSSDFMKEVFITHPDWRNLESISFQEQSEFNEVKKQNILYKLHSIQEYEILNKKIIAEKINFIEENGITEYFEENLIQAIILSSRLKVVKVIFFDDTKMYSINTNYLQNI